ncbi:hypothetical protein BWI15_20395 [Kribbella sp. ALI-6-A]|uniref:hypothetical protein n=1 Tax=Kribbella sp. ALI-6-A TaxID=1933817 RepID=UPI00097C4A4B|nr:hypothetical protein [Kribbella sp. ALI-6-A]ONI72398.1 hypothetical protein BWI15_20395 [Kribbella sp. ALI-6-A]
MLKRSIALAGAAVLAGVLGTGTASAGATRAAGVTDVQVAWVDAEHTNLKITWTETAPAANTLVLTGPAGGGLEFGTTTAGQPNEYVIDSASLGNSSDPAEKNWIEVSDGSGTPGRSPDFDRFNYAGRTATLAFTAEGSLQWTLPADTSTDGTPDDPLDFAKTYTYAPQQRIDTVAGSSGECEEVNLPQTGSPTGTVPSRGTPYNLFVNVDNEWGAAQGPYVTVTTTKSITMTAPAATTYGTATTLTGVLSGASLYESGHPPACEETTGPVANQPVVIQQRTSPTAAWTTVGTTKTDAQGKYTAVLTNPGHREYRVVRANQVAAGSAAYGGTGGSASVRAITRVVSAKFITPTITLGTQPQAYLWVDPAGTQQAALQFKNASGVWQGLSYKTLSAGRGLLTFPWNRRGTTQFRWWIPATATADATYSGVFTLTVR